MNKLFMLLFIGFIFSISLASAVTITDIFGYSNPFTTSSSSIQLGWNITTDYMNNLTFGFDSVNYSLYDSSLVLFYNFDNRSALGENDTVVKDISSYGNNGTVVGGSNISWTPNGKYGGAFNFSGNVNSINVSLPVINYSLNYTISFWIKAPIQATTTVIADNYDATNKNFDCEIFGVSTIKMTCYTNNGATTQKQFSQTTGVTPNVWHHITMIADWQSGKYYFYNDGSFESVATVTSPPITQQGTKRLFTIGSRRNTGQYFNGSLDDVMLFNRSLSANEISQLYQSSLTKYDSQNWTASFNQSLSGALNSTITSYDWNYNLCSSNSTGSEVCSANHIITQIILTSTLISNFTNTIGTINNNFYGANIQRLSYQIQTENGYTLMIDTNNDGTPDTYTNLSWHEQEWNNAKLGYFREMLKPVQLYSNTSASSGVNFTGNISKIIQEVKWACDNNKRILLNIHSLVPLFLANSSNMCSSANYTCPPNNFTIWNNIVIDMINRSTSNGLYTSCVDVEFGNEPDTTSAFLIDLAVDNINKSIYFNQIYNSTRTIIKSVYPTMSVGGYAGLTSVGGSSSISNPNLFTNFLGNFSNQMDFLSVHIYSSSSNTYIGEGYFQSILTNVLNNCSFYSANCSRILIDEWNNYNSAVQNSSNTNQYSADLGYVYSIMLNNYPSNISSMFFQWAEAYNYSNTGFYPEYPKRWSAVSEAGLDNPTPTYYPPYNVTKNFATYCPAGSTVYTSSSDDSTIKTVTCKDGNKYNIIVINTDTNSKNISINLTLVGTSLNSLTDSNDVDYLVNSNIANLGIIDSYGIMYLSSNSLNGSYNGYNWIKESDSITDLSQNLFSIFTNTNSSSQWLKVFNLTNDPNPITITITPNKVLNLSKGSNYYKISDINGNSITSGLNQYFSNVTIS